MRICACHGLHQTQILNIHLVHAVDSQPGDTNLSVYLIYSQLMMKMLGGGLPMEASMIYRQIWSSSPFPPAVEVIGEAPEHPSRQTPTEYQPILKVKTSDSPQFDDHTLRHTIQDCSCRPKESMYLLRCSFQGSLPARPPQRSDQSRDFLHILHGQKHSHDTLVRCS